MLIRYGIVGLLLSVIACQSRENQYKMTIPQAIDQHTFANKDEAVITHLDLDISVDFQKQIVSGSASYQIDQDSLARSITLDINGLQIDSVLLEKDGQISPTTFLEGEPIPFLGASLKIDLPRPPDKVIIYYHTKPDALALQWLNPRQTLDKKHPFLFTQGQAILTRSWIPVQDSPGIRFTYQARVKVPKDLMAVMSANNPQTKNDNGLYEFTMDLPIPAYLMALAVGDLAFRSISDRSGVYAEPGMIEAATYEMADLEKMIQAAEQLYGPYQWGRYDIIVLPPSFPFGGMENPKLTFATPTIIAGDRSLTSLVAHELAHSWSGNLVTNATWDDFWINEGHTVYLERRIMEQLYGKEYAGMLALLGYQDLLNTIGDLGDTSRDTHLKLHLTGRDPDDGMNDIAYEKGALLLQTLEEKAGRENFDRFLRNYFRQFEFKSISTEQWEAYVMEHLLDSLKIDINIENWLYAPGIPEEHARINSDKFKEVDRRVREFVRIGRLDRSSTRNWTTHEWLHFIRHVPADLHISFYKKLDDVFRLSASGNSEILAAWLELSIQSKYLEGHNEKELEAFLIRVGRRKFLTPLYKALIQNGQTELARSIFEKAKDNYHSIAVKSISDLLEGALLM
jgi:leukotriene-A4 hydrolase